MHINARYPNLPHFFDPESPLSLSLSISVRVGIALKPLVVFVFLILLLFGKAYFAFLINRLSHRRRQSHKNNAKIGRALGGSGKMQEKIERASDLGAIKVQSLNACEHRPSR